jgi:hypothetical protein
LYHDSFSLRGISVELSRRDSSRVIFRFFDISVEFLNSKIYKNIIKGETKMSIQVLLKETKNKLENQVKSINIYDLMILELLDHADWLVTEFTKICREKAEEKANRDKDAFNYLFKTCLYETKDWIRQELEKRVKRIADSAILLFTKFYNYELRYNLGEFYTKAKEIINEAVKQFYPYENPPSN